MTAVLVLAGAVVVLDQITKAIALAHLAPGLPVVVLDRFLSLTLVMNPGLAFGLLGTVPPAWRWVVAALSLVALLVLARVALRVLPTGGWPARRAIGLIFGGAVVNRSIGVGSAPWSTSRRYWRAGPGPPHVAASAIIIGVSFSRPSAGDRSPRPRARWGTAGRVPSSSHRGLARY